MAWYTKLQKEGYEVRGSVDKKTNSFPKERVYHYETKGGEYLRDETVKKPKDATSSWKPPRIPILNENGNQKITEEYIHRDVFVNCKDGNKIFCYTAEKYNYRKHTYEVELSTARWNKLREFYNNHIGDESDYTYMGEDKDKKPKQMFNNELMLEKIKKDGRLYDFIDGDTEMYFKCDDFELLDFLEPRRNKKNKKGVIPSNKHPFHRDYLDWSNNRKAVVPQEEMEKLKQARQSVYGVVEFGGKDTLQVARDVSEKNDEFCEKYKITEEVRRRNKIKDTDRIIYFLGLWDKYIKMWDR